MLRCCASGTEGTSNQGARPLRRRVINIAHYSAWEGYVAMVLTAFQYCVDCKERGLGEQHHMDTSSVHVLLFSQTGVCRLADTPVVVTTWLLPG